MRRRAIEFWHQPMPGSLTRLVVPPSAAGSSTPEALLVQGRACLREALLCSDVACRAPGSAWSLTLARTTHSSIPRLTSSQEHSPRQHYTFLPPDALCRTGDIRRRRHRTGHGRDSRPRDELVWRLIEVTQRTHSVCKQSGQSCIAIPVINPLSSRMRDGCGAGGQGGI